MLRRVGRNLLLFQQIEGLLKLVLANSKTGGTLLDFKERQQKQISTISKTMFGLLVDKYVREVLQDAGVDVPEEEAPSDWITHSFKVTGDTEFVESMRREMKLLTEQRNDLVHGFFPRWQPESPEKLEEALAYLDTQREKMLPVLDHLKTMVSHIGENWQRLAEFTASEEFHNQYELMFLQVSPLVSFLRDVAFQMHRKDGWTYLARAGSLANSELPDEVRNLKEIYG